MSDGPMNGFAPGAPSEEQLQRAQQQIEKLSEPLRQTLGIVIRGIIVSCPGFSPETVLSVVAWQTGNLLAGAVNADVSSMLQIRKALKESFSDGVAKQKMPTLITRPAVNG